MSLRDCHSRIRRHRPLVIATPETDERFDAPERLRIQRDQGCKRPVCLAARKEEKLCGDPIVMDGMGSLRARTMRAEFDEHRRRFDWQEIWRRREGQHGWIHQGGPREGGSASITRCCIGIANRTGWALPFPSQRSRDGRADAVITKLPRKTGKLLLPGYWTLALLTIEWIARFL
ncbi:hypothetical protein CK227_24505 [Mesorhizobium sp. WSM4308]|nr:hypothetical protein CK232_24860 [Mesorhizobium sp. WSM4304]PBB72841.1 hypothetical protein CK227_24505 [Mesorhizobium sp. WSM4308]